MYCGGTFRPDRPSVSFIQVVMIDYKTTKSDILVSRTGEFRLIVRFAVRKESWSSCFVFQEPLDDFATDLGSQLSVDHISSFSANCEIFRECFPKVQTFCFSAFGLQLRDLNFPLRSDQLHSYVPSHLIGSDSASNKNVCLYSIFIFLSDFFGGLQR